MENLGDILETGEKFIINFFNVKNVKEKLESAKLFSIYWWLNAIFEVRCLLTEVLLYDTTVKLSGGVIQPTTLIFF